MPDGFPKILEGQFQNACVATFTQAEFFDAPEALTVRDQFAMAALPRALELAAADSVDSIWDTGARYAYEIASAMLEARKR